jgi:hypothetical protein
MNQKKNYIKAFINFIASKKFFYVIISLFIFQAAWIGLSNNYGSPHDEKYHVGVIQIYSQHLTPFMNGQPTSYDQFGDVSRDTSYLYHYLMSFPYRLISMITNNLMTQVILLRLFNILFVILGILIFKKILDEMFKKPIVSNLSLFAVIMTPVFTYVSEGVNYDNLVFLGFAASLYLTIKLIKKFRFTTALLWLSVNLLTILVKFSYGPLAFVLVIGTAIYYLVKKIQIIPEIKYSLKNTNRIKMILLVLLLIVAGGLFTERYVGNLVAYGTPMPDCAKVLNVERCSSWATWERNAQIKQRHLHKKRANIASYATTWVKTMESSSFGIYKTSSVKKALPIIKFAGYFVLALFLLLTAFNIKYILKRPALLVALGSIVFYSIALFAINYRDYLVLASPVAIQGRYLILIMPLMMGFGLFFANKLLEAHKKLWLIFVVLLIIVFLQGGVVTYIISSTHTWWWPDKTVIDINEAAKTILKPIVYQ